MKTAIVIGATGLVGRSLVEQLSQNNHVDKVIAITRRPASYSSPKVDNQVVNFDHLEDFSECFSGDWFFLCLGTTKKQAGSVEAQRVVDYDYQYKAACLAAKQSVAHYLLVSSVSANANSQSSYLKMKGVLENQIKQLPFKRISIFQPSLLLGERPDVRITESLFTWIMPLLCKLPFLQRYRPIKGTEVATKMLLVSQEQGDGILTYTLDEVFPSNLQKT